MCIHNDVRSNSNHYHFYNILVFLFVYIERKSSPIWRWRRIVNQLHKQLQSTYNTWLCPRFDPCIASTLMPSISAPKHSVLHLSLSSLICASEYWINTIQVLDYERINHFHVLIHSKLNYNLYATALVKKSQHCSKNEVTFATDIREWYVRLKHEYFQREKLQMFFWGWHLYCVIC